MIIRQQDIIEMVDQMPAFPRSVHRVMELTSDINCNPRDLVEVIEHDPVMITKILRLVNSPYFGLAQKITSVNHAVVYIGLNTVKNLAVSAATVGVLPRRNEAGFDMDAFLMHSLSTATIARLLARKMKIQERETFDFFLSGLLHDFGKIVLAHFMPEEYRTALDMSKDRDIPLHDAERRIFTMDHSQVGSLLVEKWQLPPNLVEALKMHHCHTSELSPLTGAVSAADQISKELRLGDSGEHLVEGIPESISKLLGSDISAIVATLGDIQSEIEKAEEFIKI